MASSVEAGQSSMTASFDQNEGRLVRKTAAQVQTTDLLDRAASDTSLGTNGKTSSEALQEQQRPKGLRFAILFTCIVLGSFSIGYDTSCIATLTPVITDHFHALNSFGWYAIAYVLAQCATMLVYGQLYSFYSMKTMFMTALFVFVIGSIVTATAPSSPVFILGRALSGLGSAGALAGTNIIVAHTTPLKFRATYMAITGAVESAALAFGPLLSGVIAHYSSWRIAFYIIIPVGVAIIAAVFFCVRDFRQPENASLSRREKINRLDLTGFALDVPMSVCLTLGLQWAGITYPWGNWRVVLLLVLAGALAILFLEIEHRAGNLAMMPLRMLRQRSVAFASVATFSNYASLSIIGYYIPIYFQAVRGASTLGSALMYLPLAVGLAVSVLFAGSATSYLGYYTPVLIFGSVLMAVGAALLTTLDPNTPEGKWIGFQILYGVGLGLSFQQPFTAVQTVLKGPRVSTALVTLSFMQQLGGIISLAIAQNVFTNKLSSSLADLVPGPDGNIVRTKGALGIVAAIPPQYRDAALLAYSKAITNVFYIAFALTCLVVVSALGIEWKSVKSKEETPDSEMQNRGSSNDQSDSAAHL